METTAEFSAEDLEIVELPQREALGKGGNKVNSNGNKGGLLGSLVVLIDLFWKTAAPEQPPDRSPRSTTARR